MFTKLDMFLLRAKTKWDGFINRLLYEEKGGVGMIEIVVMVVIILAVAGIFRTQLIELVNTTFTKATDWVGQN